MVKKKRVYEVARDLKISSEALVEIIRALGAEVKSHMSAVDDAVVEALHAQFDREKEKIKRAGDGKRERVAAAPELATPGAEGTAAPPPALPAPMATLVAEPPAAAPPTPPLSAPAAAPGAAAPAATLPVAETPHPR